MKCYHLHEGGGTGFFGEVVVVLEGAAVALTLTGIIVGLWLEWGRFAYALAVMLFQRKPPVNPVIES